jgi:peptidoglycan/LPS O-acetylase OafA/YrhL
MSFDLLRLIAAVMVVFSHCFPLAGRPPLTIWGVEDFGALGVSIFFVISGYLVTASYLRDPKTYLLKRVLRIEPALIVSLIVTVIALGFLTTAPGADYWPAAALYVIRNALLFPATYELPGLFEGNPVPGVVNGVLWTLRLEFAFYLVLMLVRANPRLILAGAVACAVTYLGLQMMVPDWADARPSRVVFLIARNGFLFFAGSAMWVYRPKLAKWLPELSVVAFPFAGPLALPTAVIGLARPGKLPADLSYGLYIYAFPVQQVLAMGGQLNVVTALAATLPFAALSWFLVEKPMQRFKPRAGSADLHP